MIVYREASTLARDLDIPLKTLYAVSNRLPAHYHRAVLPKRDGGVRTLTVPDDLLKHIQRRIADRLLAYRPVSPHATAYRCGAGIVKNASLHAGRAYLLKLDIRHFFDSVLYSTVKERVFPPEIFSEPLRVLLAMLCYYGDALPQGAPSSPAIANLILRDFDDDLGAWCARRGVTYTRYCDDLTFSSDRPLDGVAAYAAARLRPLGFFLNGRKTLLLHAGQRQAVTGLVVNEKVSVPASYRRKLRQELYYCRTFGVAGHLARTGSDLSPRAYLLRLQGRVAFWLQVDRDNPEALSARAWLRGELRQWNSKS